MSDVQAAPGGMGRIVEEDSRDHRFLMSAIQPSEVEKPMIGQWVYRRGPILNQGQTSTCVAHAWRAWMDGEPLRTKKGPQPFGLYDECVVNDQWQDNDVDPERRMGTSVRAGAKVLQSAGHVASYVWAFDIDDVRRWVLSGQGGVVLGIDWHGDMSYPASDGMIRATGSVQGGHAIYLFGADDHRQVVYLQNSWGADWGGWPHSKIPNTRVYRGCALLSYDDLDRLLRRRGEACAAVEKRAR